MKAIVYHSKGSPDVFRCEEVDKPTAGDKEVLIKIRAASVNALDWRMKSTRPGRDVAGHVEAVGGKATQFKPGDDVFGTCRGAFAEYVCVSEEQLAPKPANLSFAEAAAVPVAAITALQGLRDKGRIQEGHKVLVDGASGGVGTFAVQIAKSFGAQVTAVCSTRNVETARSIGADQVIDYTKEDFTQSGQRYDLILAANAHRSIFAYRRALTPRGIYVMIGGGWSQIFQGLLLGPFLSLLGKKKMRFMMTKTNKNDLLFLKDLLEAGKVRPILDRRYPLSGAADALRYLEEGHAQGKVVITLEDSSGTIGAS